MSECRRNIVIIECDGLFNSSWRIKVKGLE